MMRLQFVTGAMIVCVVSSVAQAQGPYTGPWDSAADAAAEKAVVKLGATRGLEIRATVLTIPSLVRLAATEILTPAIAVAQQSAQATKVNRFTLAEGRVSFLAPPDFTALTAAELVAKYRRPDPSRRVVANAKRTTTIRYEMGLEAPSSDMEEGRKALAAGYEQLGKLKWVVNKVSRIRGREWMQFEFTASPTGVEFHNIVQVSIYEGHLLIFTCASPSTDFPSFEQALRASMATITITP